MNERDSEIMLQLLEQQGYLLCADLDSADAVIVNTCSIRGKAEQKAYSFIGSCGASKEKAASDYCSGRLCGAAGRRQDEGAHAPCGYYRRPAGYLSAT